MTTLPKSLASALPSRERRSPGLSFETALAGSRKVGPVRLRNPGLVRRRDERIRDLPVVRRGAARWEAEGELFALEWVDPARTPLAGRTAGDPSDFMRQTSEYVNHSIVMHAQTETDAGTTITAWVRRAPTGFSRC